MNRSTTTAVAERYSKELRRRPLDEEDWKFQLIKIGLIDVGFDNGIVLYFNCKKEEGFNSLKENLDDGELNAIAEADFNKLLCSDETPVTVSLHFTNDDRKRCDTYLRCRAFIYTSVSFGSSSMVFINNTTDIKPSLVKKSYCCKFFLKAALMWYLTSRCT